MTFGFWIGNDVKRWDALRFPALRAIYKPQSRLIKMVYFL
jgi:hypothetical protein